MKTGLSYVRGPGAPTLHLQTHADATARHCCQDTRGLPVHSALRLRRSQQTRAATSVRILDRISACLSGASPPGARAAASSSSRAAGDAARSPAAGEPYPSPAGCDGADTASSSELSKSLSTSCSAGPSESDMAPRWHLSYRRFQARGAGPLALRVVLCSASENIQKPSNRVLAVVRAVLACIKVACATAACAGKVLVVILTPRVQHDARSAGPTQLHKLQQTALLVNGPKSCKLGCP